ncbi:hypothetical protein [Flavobacterium sp.]|uniref:hypothetical protein n=1 Tax=Flavobacterium sp. TaxID=239 RepID=UPI0038FD250D
MNDNQIEQVKQILTEWNPLGEFAVNVPELNNYDTEAKDLASYIDKKSSVKKIDQILTEILEQAFDFPLNLEESLLYASKIKNII